MSDVSAPAPAPAAAPAAPETPINPNPVSPPTPIGSQAPDRPAGETATEHRPQSRREAIQAAFDKAQAARPKPEPRKARMGDNNPPEELKVERGKGAKADPEKPEINLRKPPTDQPVRERVEHGHFAPRGTPAGADAGRTVGPGPQQQHPQLPEGTPFREAPQRMSERAKAEWAKTPESVRGDVHRMQQEFNNAYRRYKPDVEVFNSIRPFHQLARSQGTTLERALNNYVTMEHKLRNDVVGGLDVIVSNLNLRSPDGQKLTLQDVAWHILNQSPEQHKLTQHANAQNAQTQQIGQLHQMVNQLAQHAQRVQYQQQFTHTRSAIDRFAETHPRFDELGDLIEREIRLGFNLDAAYQRAELLRPARAAQTRSTTAQTRTGDRSISGAPSSPSNGAARRPEKPVGRREAIASAMRRASGSV